MKKATHSPNRTVQRWERRTNPMSHQFDVWTPTGEDLKRWVACLATWPKHEVYAHPGFLSLFASTTDSIVCIHYQDDAGEVLCPLVLRQLRHLPFAGDDFLNRLDCTSAPFGIGGPFVRTSGEIHGVTRRFNAAFKSWAHDFRVLSHFTTFSPVTGPSEGYPGDVVARMPTVVKAIDVKDLEQDIHKQQRKAIRRARRGGVSVDHDLELADVAGFLRAYESTSARRGGFSASYALTRDVVERIFRVLRNYVALFHARVDGRIVSSELVLLSGETVRFFRGGTLSDALATRANQLLKYEIMEWGRGAGYRWYQLGGGNSVDGDDPLFQYKRSFALSGVRTLHVGNWIVDSEGYGRLVASRRRHDLDHHHRWSVDRSFFPLYRAPLHPAEGDSQ